MPLVFVHGVNVRQGRRYEIEVLQRNQHFTNIFFKMLGHTIKPESIFSPYWGDLATNLSPGNLFLPSVEAHLPGEKLLTHFREREHHDGESHSFIAMAKTAPMSDVMDLMIAAMGESESSEDAEEAAALSKLAYKSLGLSKRFSNLEEQLDWLQGVETDAQLVSKLETELDLKKPDDRKQKHFGAERLHRAADWIKHQSSETMKGRISELGKRAIDHAKTDLEFVRSDFKGTISDIKRVPGAAKKSVKVVQEAGRRARSHVSAFAVTQPVRRLFHNRLFLFVGDAFHYFGQRGTPDAPGLVARRILENIELAHAAKDPETDPYLVVVAHSMGGNLMCDVASYFAPNREIDLLITVGAQFPLFADLNMFPGLAQSRPIPKPANVKRWINVYDVNDVFGFAAVPLFTGVEDIEYASGRFGMTTHADCFKFPTLYERMAEAVLNPPKA